LLILFPWRGEQLGTFFVTLIMFAYVIVGMWMRQHYLIVLGVGVTIATLVGYVLDMCIRGGVIDMPRILNLWLAVTGGGALLLTGILLRRQRRDKP
jgi:hypothetical protein